MAGSLYPLKFHPVNNTSTAYNGPNKGRNLLLSLLSCFFLFANALLAGGGYLSWPALRGIPWPCVLR